MYKRKKIFLSAMAAFTALPLAACDVDFFMPDYPLPSEQIPLESTGSNVMKEYTITSKKIPICAHRGIRIISEHMPSIEHEDTEKWELGDNDLFIQNETNLDFSSVLIGSRMQELENQETTLKHFWASDTDISAEDPNVETVEREPGVFYNCETYTLTMTAEYEDNLCVVCGETYSREREVGEEYHSMEWYEQQRRYNFYSRPGGAFKVGKNWIFY